MDSTRLLRRDERRGSAIATSGRDEAVVDPWIHMSVLEEDGLLVVT